MEICAFTQVEIIKRNINGYYCCKKQITPDLLICKPGVLRLYDLFFFVGNSIKFQTQL